MFYSADTKGFYDLEIHGSNMPKDVVEITDSEYEALIIGQENGKRIGSNGSGIPILLSAPSITQEQEILNLSTWVQRNLNEFAKIRGYDGIIAVCTYNTSSIPRFREEGTHALLLRDQTWETFYAIMGDVLNGTRTLPTIEHLNNELPILEWP